MSESQSYAVLAHRARPLLNLLLPVHGAGLQAVLAYGPGLDRLGPRDPLRLLVVAERLDVATLQRTAPALGQLRRAALEPLFVEARELARSADVFPLEFLEMQATAVPLHGANPVAELRLEAGPVRIQVEEELRVAQHGLRQQVACLGHRPREMRQLLADQLAGLQRAWRGLLWLHGADNPADPDTLATAVARAYDLDLNLLHQLRAVEPSGAQPAPDRLWELLAAYDGHLAHLISLTDTLVVGAAAAGTVN